MPESALTLPASLVLPEKTVSGRGTLYSLAPESRRFGTRGIILHGRALESGDRLARLLATFGPASGVIPVRHQGGEPTLDQVSELSRLVRHHRAEWVAGIGGGSILDLAKAGAALAHAPHPPDRYHDGKVIEGPGLVFLAVPTTAGTGAEATMNSVLTHSATGIKKSIRSPSMMARLVILDPELLSDCPAPVIAASGLDALTQAIESYTSRHATWLSDTLALRSATLIARTLAPVFRNPLSAEADDLLTGSYLAGVALSFSRLGVVHGLAHPLGSLYGLPHGVVCAACLPHALALNRDAFGAKYADLEHVLGGDPVTQVESLLTRLGLSSPFTGKPLRDPERIIAETLSSGSTAANPKPIVRADVEWLLERLFRDSR